MQVVDNNGNVFGSGLQVNGPDGKPKTSGGGGGGTPSGPAGGDLFGTYPNPSVTWNNGLPTYDLQYYPLSLNPAGYLTSITSSDVTTALGYTPYSNTNPSGFITSSALTPYLTTATAASTYYPLSNPSGFITTAALSGYLTVATAASTYYPLTNPNGYISGITGPMVTSALGYIPYNATNPSGYISGITSSDVTSALGFTPYNSTNPSGFITSSALGPYLTAATAASTYQPTLVSGTNIKTVNSTSLVGSGDVAVQPTLVSGTNIKTVNGNSLLGSGDLTISGGGGLAGLNALTAIPAGLTYGFTAAITAAVPTTYITQFNGIVLSPLILARNMTYSSIRINVTTFTAGCLSRIVIYSDLNGLPDSKLYESANIDCSTNGLKTVTVTGSFTAGTIYWIGIHSNNNCTITGINQGATIPIMNTLINGSTVVAWRYSYVFGAAPATLNQANRTPQQGTLQTILFVI